MKFLTLALFLGCGNSPHPTTPDPEAAKCISHRTAKELECVDLFQTKAEIDSCRAKVKSEIECVDAGTEGGTSKGIGNDSAKPAPGDAGASHD